MSERYSKIFTLKENLYADNVPVYTFPTSSIVNPPKILSQPINTNIYS